MCENVASLQSTKQISVLEKLLKFGCLGKTNHTALKKNKN